MSCVLIIANIQYLSSRGGTKKPLVKFKDHLGLPDSLDK